jgi:hypothetical protein
MCRDDLNLNATALVGKMVSAFNQEVAENAIHDKGNYLEISNSIAVPLLNGFESPTMLTNELRNV